MGLFGSLSGKKKFWLGLFRVKIIYLKSLWKNKVFWSIIIFCIENIIYLIKFFVFVIKIIKLSI